MTYYERNLPHWQPPAQHLFVTWRLSGSLPLKVIQALKAKRGRKPGEQFRDFDTHLDGATFGPSWMNDGRIADLVHAAIQEVNDGQSCRMHAFVVMPNHVHCLLDAGSELKAITRKLKGRTARAANLLLRRTGKSFWQDESFDHWIRSSAEFERVRMYIEQNPVKAGLVKRPEQWKWSSAYR